MERGAEEKVIRLREVGSTNDEAYRLAKEVGVLVFVRADVQISGRGRMGRRWISEEGGLWMSGAFLKSVDRDNYKLMLGSAVVVDDVVSPLLREFGYRTELHFPNDIFVNGHKLCGILVEEKEGYVIVGIGLNVNQDEPPIPTATTLKVLTGRKYDLDALAGEIAEGIKRVYGMPFEEVFRIWRDRLATTGRCVSVWVAGGGEVKGRLVDVHPDMVLEIERDGEKLYVPAEYVLSISEI